MAKMFYTMEETKAALGRTEDEIKTLSREGKLREFRDGPRLMFKADQVESLKGSLGPRDTIDINDSGAPIPLMDSKSGTSAGTGGPIPLSGESRAGGGAIRIDDSVAGEIGLAGSASGAPAARGGSRAGGSGTGMNVFNPDDADLADPSAATRITSPGDSASLEAAGSGSGLLDLTRESDDTSLGAVIDEINPNAKRDAGGTKSGTSMGTGMAMPAPAAGRPAAATGRGAPVLITKPDPTAPAFGGLALGGAVLSLFSLWVLAAAVGGSQPGFMADLASKGLFIVVGIFAVVALVCAGLGFALGKVLK